MLVFFSKFLLLYLDVGSKNNGISIFSTYKLYDIFATNLLFFRTDASKFKQNTVIQNLFFGRESSIGKLQKKAVSSLFMMLFRNFSFCCFCLVLDSCHFLKKQMTLKVQNKWCKKTNNFSLLAVHLSKYVIVWLNAKTKRDKRNILGVWLENILEKIRLKTIFYSLVVRDILGLKKRVEIWNSLLYSFFVKKYKNGTLEKFTGIDIIMYPFYLLFSKFLHEHFFFSYW